MLVYNEMKDFWQCRNLIDLSIFYYLLNCVHWCLYILAYLIINFVNALGFIIIKLQKSFFILKSLHVKNLLHKLRIKILKSSLNIVCLAVYNNRTMPLLFVDCR